MEQKLNAENKNVGRRETGNAVPAGQARSDRNRRPRRRGQEYQGGDGAQNAQRRENVTQQNISGENMGSRGGSSANRHAGRQANGNGGNGGRGGNGRSRGRDQRNRGGLARGGKPDHAERLPGEENDANEAREEMASTEELRNDFYVSPSMLSPIKDVLLEDTFSPLHEAEVYDPDAEATAKRILDAEGPLLFRAPETSEPVENPVEVPDAEQEKTEIVGVRFKRPGKVYYFDPGQHAYRRGEYAIVETARGAEYGEVWVENTLVPVSEVVSPLRPVLRAATAEDARRNDENAAMEQDAMRICREKIARHKLDMKLVEAQYTFDRAKLLFYFTSEGRVDFRELVKDLAGVFRTRIELRQIGIRDEAKMLGGLGTCGRPLCCAGFLSDFVQVSIKMAKEQNLSLNSAKISGCCGRLMCCLRYESETYEEEIRLTPPVDSCVQTPDGNGVVIGNNPLRGTVLVRFPESADGKTAAESKTYHRDAVRVMGTIRKGGKADNSSDAKDPDRSKKERTERTDKKGRADKVDPGEKMSQDSEK